MKREQPGFREEGIWPSLMVGAADALPWALFLLAQDGAQPPSDKPVELAEGGVMGMFEVAEPAAQQRVEILHGAGEAVAACAPRLLSYAVLELVQALLAHATPAGFETVAEELEPLPRLPAVADIVFSGCSARPFSLTQARTSARAASASRGSDREPGHR